MAKENAPRESVLKEWPLISKYRVRLLAPAVEPTLDIREYVSSDTWEGYTRRGIKLSSREHLRMLRDVLTELLERR